MAPLPRRAALLLVPAAALALAAAAGTLRGSEPPPASTAPSPTPAVDPARDFSLAPDQPWSRAEGYLSRLNFTLGVSDRGAVKVCHACTSADVTIAPEHRSLYLRADAFPEGMRVMGRLVRHDEAVVPQLGFPEDAVSDTAYLLVTSPTSAVVMYRDAAGRIAFSAPWVFHPNPDGHQWTQPIARWRQGGAGQDGASPAARGPSAGEANHGSYGWMACVSGCCQFWVPDPH